MGWRIAAAPTDGCEDTAFGRRSSPEAGVGVPGSMRTLRSREGTGIGVDLLCDRGRSRPATGSPGAVNGISPRLLVRARRNSVRVRTMGAMMDKAYEGSCHCGAIGWTYRTALEPSRWQVRSCQCSFCRRHATRCTTDPAGTAEFSVADPDALHRYRFGLADRRIPDVPALRGVHRRIRRRSRGRLRDPEPQRAEDPGRRRPGPDADRTTIRRIGRDAFGAASSGGRR